MDGSRQTPPGVGPGAGADAPPSGAVAAIPNLLLASRLALAALLPWVSGDWRTGVVVGAALSDLLDGALSRIYHASSLLGQILNPIADKAFVLVVLATVLVEGQLQAWQVALVGCRELAVLAGSGALVLRKGWPAVRRMPPSLLGKATTAAQFALILALVASWPAAAAVLLVPTVVLSLLAGVDYLRRYR